MPKRPREYKSKTPRRYRRKGTVTTATARPRAPMASRGYRLNPIEKKVNDLNTDAAGGQTITSAGWFQSMSLIAVGSDFTQRIGRKIFINYFSMKLFLKPQALAAPGVCVNAVDFTGCQLRLMLIYDTQPNGAYPGVNDILWTNVGNRQPFSLINLNNRDRFHVFWDKLFVFDPLDVTQGVAGTKLSYAVKKFIRIKKETIYSNVLSDIASISTGNLFLFGLSNIALSTDNACPCISYHARIRFSDP